MASAARPIFVDFAAVSVVLRSPGKSRKVGDLGDKDLLQLRRDAG